MPPMSTIAPPANATASNAARLQALLEALLPTWLPPDQRAEAELVLARIVAGEDTPELVEVALDLLCLFSHHSGELGLLAGTLCKSLRVSPGVRGAVLRHALCGGKMHSPLAMYPRSAVLAWLAVASPLTLMDDAERALLASLPDPIEAWRGGRGVTPRQAATGLSWTLDPDRARWFANRWSPAPALMVRASFPKAAVLAYFDEPEERELIVNWRRARGLATIS
jgi:hypothetical protein